MIRALAFAVIILIGLIALLVSDHAKPITIANHSSGRWSFNDADYPVCIRIVPPPLKQKGFIHTATSDIA